ncbi:adenosylcobinamide-GDP ribazoletransferase [Candidatus Nitrotoga sp. M5]|uniref:adenosylcobinamide-GDP ribazoletransferase n=1 Tax=Candidatus Nitrotoga sp. M5 TaxID=2890409 RepID=UPI001EF5755B|nr:adenosylcobinamide-GDP ribazoletransferase [Candidatus Nitrotoga sp. M5]CAH1387366.1 Adenosylcobinamide-GDP ribazoletransferase [Candidatus Nitrotoga sp. M5]
MLRPFIIALQLLTRLPTPRLHEISEQEIGRSLVWYPLVGLLLGLILVTLGWLGNGMPTGLHAAVLLAFWVMLTGAIHLDGLADSADAWLGGLGDREKTLAIMKDPYCGPAAVVTLVLVLLIKFTALEHLITTKNWEALVLVPVLGRTALVLLFLTTPYVRENGLGSLLAKHLPRRASLGIVFFTLAAISIILGVDALWLFLVIAGMFFALRTLMLRRIGGITGDTAGALVEITEALVLLTAALMK